MTKRKTLEDYKKLAEEYPEVKIGYNQNLTYKTIYELEKARSKTDYNKSDFLEIVIKEYLKNKGFENDK